MMNDECRTRKNCGFTLFVLHLFLHNAPMLRRVHLSLVTAGSIALPADEAHHIRDVLRLVEGEMLELFDSHGNLATATIKHINSANVVVLVEAVQTTVASSGLIVASAIPKGDRADWMVEKLSELGVARFVPLAAERSGTLPGGKNKLERWERIAIEAAKQSRRAGTMSIGPLTPLDDFLKSAPQGWYLSTAADAIPARQAVDQIQSEIPTLVIGPEGGWTDAEISKMNAAGLRGVGLTSTILRVETAAVSAAALVRCMAL